MEEGVTGRAADAGAPIGVRLAAAREAKGLSLDDVAAATRVPRRHLATIEANGTDGLPAIPYTLGFVRSFARMVDLDAEAAAAEYRATLNAAPPTRHIMTEPYEPADPARVPPRWLALVALFVALVIAVVYGVWRSNQNDGAQIAATASDAPPPARTPTAAGPTPAPLPATPTASGLVPAGGRVTVTATAPVWISITEKNGPKLFEDMMAAGQTFEVPAAAVDPRLRTGRPQALSIKVGDTVVPPVGRPERLLVGQSLKADALLNRPAAPADVAPLVPRAGTDARPGA